MNDENRITLLDENEKEIDFEIIATLNVEKSEYAILQPLGEDEGVVIFKIMEVAGEEVLESIQEEEELNLVVAAYEELLLEEE
ncbi:DUF1292 domain-containing protein [Marinisporobacter balticus]|uniref:Uncharacterized protein DUF1292 n=1 Tax=Marinisporobacter balticus TaxID=2018667 RepID=A0A4R2L1L2_9FIRM|nr:DUF1292 domain-containing protein [Marinisporobacter balticus]TCO79077.1 uncharacterized protein DUF1292 [Marinisporobacter balticus]